MKEPQDHLRSKKKPVRKSVWIAGDSELAEELSELEADLSRAKTLSETRDEVRREAALQRVTELEAEIAAKKIEVRENAIRFTFQAMGAKAYEALTQAHQPTEAQVKKAKEEGEDKLPFNTDTYPRALIVASVVEPEMDPEDMLAWLSDETWNDAEILSLFMTANEVNNSRRILNLGKG